MSSGEIAVLVVFAMNTVIYRILTPHLGFLLWKVLGLILWKNHTTGAVVLAGLVTLIQIT